MADQNKQNQPGRQGQNREQGTEQTSDPNREREGQRGKEREREQTRTGTEGTSTERGSSTGTGTRNTPEGDVEGIGQSRR